MYTNFDKINKLWFNYKIEMVIYFQISEITNNNQINS